MLCAALLAGAVGEPSIQTKQGSVFLVAEDDAMVGYKIGANGEVKNFDDFADQVQGNFLNAGYQIGFEAGKLAEGPVKRPIEEITQAVELLGAHPLNFAPMASSEMIRLGGTGLVALFEVYGMSTNGKNDNFIELEWTSTTGIKLAERTPCDMSKDESGAVGIDCLLPQDTSSWPRVASIYQDSKSVKAGKFKAFWSFMDGKEIPQIDEPVVEFSADLKSYNPDAGVAYAEGLSTRDAYECKFTMKGKEYSVTAEVYADDDDEQFLECQIPTALKNSYTDQDENRPCTMGFSVLDRTSGAKMDTTFSYDYHGLACSDGVKNGAEEFVDCGGTCSPSCEACGQTADDPCDTCWDPRAPGRTMSGSRAPGWAFIKGVAEGPWWCEGGYGLAMVVHKRERENNAWPRGDGEFHNVYHGVDSGQCSPNHTSVCKHSDLAINTYAEMSQKANGKLNWRNRYKAIAKFSNWCQQQIQYLPRNCRIQSARSCRGGTVPSELMPPGVRGSSNPCFQPAVSENGGWYRPSRCRWNSYYANSGTRTFGHHHCNNRVFAGSRHPEGRSLGFRSDWCGEADGWLWIR